MKSKKLLFAIQLKDEFAPLKPLIGSHKVDLIGRTENAIKNSSGLYCFRGMASGTYSVAVQARYYCDRIVEVDTRSLDPKLPVVDVFMSPNLIYPFPKRTTHVRGSVRIKGDNDSIVRGARVRVRKNDKEFFTDENGRFIFYFNQKNEDDEEEGTEKIIELLVTKTGFKKKMKSCILKKGETCFVEISLSQ